MTIWLLGILLVASLAALGYRQGGIRVAFSFLGILLGAVLAVPLGNLIRPLLPIFGVKNPVLIYLLPPAIIFVLFSIIFKVAAAAVHRQTDVYYKYRAGDLRMALWERLNQRLGACLGVANATLYIILLSFVIYSFSYVSVQFASPDGDPTWMRVLNRLGKDLDASGLSKVGRAVDRRELWYEAADLGGLIFGNPLVEARLSQYPGVLSLAERPEFKDIGSDKEFAEMRQRREPIMGLLSSSRMQAVVDNPDSLRTIWNTLSPDVKDLENYLKTGLSPKYDPEKILGRWSFDVNYAMILYRRSKPNLPAAEVAKVKKWMSAAFAQTEFVAMTDRQVLIKNVPQVKVPTAAVMAAPVVTQTLQGQWKDDAGKYQVSLSGAGEIPAAIDGDRLKITVEGAELVFVHEG
jgi:hypothetical protein